MPKYPPTDPVDGETAAAGFSPRLSRGEVHRAPPTPVRGWMRGRKGKPGRDTEVFHTAQWLARMRSPPPFGGMRLGTGNKKKSPKNRDEEKKKRPFAGQGPGRVMRLLGKGLGRGGARGLPGSTLEGRIGAPSSRAAGLAPDHLSSQHGPREA